MDDGAGDAAGTEDMLKLQQDLLKEVAERKRLAAKLIQRLRSEAAEGRVCLVDDKNPSSAAPFSSAKESQPAVMAFIDTPTQDQTKDQQKVEDSAPTAIPTPSPPPPSAAPKAVAPPTKAPPAPKAVTPAPPANKGPAPPPPVNKGPAPPPANKGTAPPPANKGPAVTVNKGPAPPVRAPPGSAVPPPVKKTLPPVGSPPSVSGAPAVQTPKVPKIPASITFPGSPAPKAKAAAPEKEKVTKAKEQAPKTAAKVPLEPEEKPLAGENVMKVVMVGAECAPWSKTGGLGDVMGALPKALAARGHRTMVVVPRYDDYYSVNDTKTVVRFRVFNSEHEVRYYHLYKDGVDFVFVDHGCFHGHGKEIYGGSRLDIAFRCALLCKAALEAPWHVKCGGVPYGDDNLLFIANDWHTALLPVYLEAHYRQYEQMTFARSMLVIHNMAHQGRGPFAELENFEIPEQFHDTFFLDDPIGGEHMNIMKAGIMAAHRLVAVSHGYAWECQTQEGGWGLDETLRELSWKFRGIVNGVDLMEWDPATDAHLIDDGYANYTLETMEEGKAKCKAALQKELGLPVDPDVPLLGFIGRLDYQKGVDIIRDSYDWIMDQGCQMILLGSGTHDLENDLRKMEDDNPNQCKAWVGFNVGVAHRITAGCDILLMPSRFEPCGLNQLYAMHYGTTPVVHAVGGLRDTVQPYDPFKNTGTGWTFDRAESEPLKQALHNAIETYKFHKKSFRGIQTRGMEQDLSWDKAAGEYEEVMVEAKYQW